MSFLRDYWWVTLLSVLLLVWAWRTRRRPRPEPDERIVVAGRRTPGPGQAMEASIRPGDVARRLAAHHRATRRARRSFLAAALLFGCTATWLVWRLALPRPLVPLTAAGVLAVVLVGLRVLRRRTAVRLERLGDPGPPLVPRAMLGRRYALHRRFQRVVFAVWIAPVVAGMLLAPLLQPVLPTAWRGVGVYVALLAVFFGGAVVAALLDRAKRRATGLACPACGATLVSMTGLSLDGDRCPDCGLPIVDDAGAAAIPPAVVRPDLGALPSSAQEFTERHARLERDNQADYVVLIPVAVLVFGGSLVLLMSRARSGLSPNATFVPPLAGMVASLALLMWGTQRWETRARRLGLACPSCDALLVGGAADSTTTDVRTRGVCPACGTVLWHAAA